MTPFMGSKAIVMATFWWFVPRNNDRSAEHNKSFFQSPLFIIAGPSCALQSAQCAQNVLVGKEFLEGCFEASVDQ